MMKKDLKSLVSNKYNDASLSDQQFEALMALQEKHSSKNESNGGTFNSRMEERFSIHDWLPMASAMVVFVAFLI